MHMVGKRMFHGLPAEDPQEHLDSFYTVTDTIRVQGVPRDVILMSLFPHTLDGEAYKWLMNSPPGSFQSWEELEQGFLKKYFPQSEMIKVRNKLQNFKDEDGDNLSMLGRLLAS